MQIIWYTKPTLFCLCLLKITKSLQTYSEIYGLMLQSLMTLKVHRMALKDIKDAFHG